MQDETDDSSVAAEKQHVCSQCNKSYALLSSLVAHEKLHTRVKSFKCDQCDKTFPQSRSLTEHMYSHTGEKAFKCNLCDKAFAYKTSWDAHRLSHTGERPYKCDVCDKTFAQIKNFRLHQKIHTGEKPFKCDECDKAFIQRVALVTHKRTHTGEKPFECQECGKRFISSSNLSMHKRTHNKVEKPLQRDNSSTRVTPNNVTSSGEKPLQWGQTLVQNPTLMLPMISPVQQVSHASTANQFMQPKVWFVANGQCVPINMDPAVASSLVQSQYLQNATMSQGSVGPQPDMNTSTSVNAQNASSHVVNQSMIKTTPQPDTTNVTAVYSQNLQNTVVNQKIKEEPHQDMTSIGRSTQGTVDSHNVTVKEESQSNMTTTTWICSQNPHSDPVKEEPRPVMINLDRTTVAAVDPHSMTVKEEPRPDMTTMTASLSQNSSSDAIVKIKEEPQTDINFTTTTYSQDSRSTGANQEVKQETPLDGSTDRTTLAAVDIHRVTVKEEPRPDITDKRLKTENSDEVGIGTNLFFSLISGQNK